MEFAFFDILPLIVLLMGVVLVAGATLGRLSRFMGVPAGLLVLCVGMLLGESGPGGIEFEDFTLTYAVGSFALGLILFHGGLSTSLDTLRLAWKPAMTLATVGVIGVTLITAFGIWIDPFSNNSIAVCLLLGAILGSTDAAAVFDLLSGQRIKGRAKEIIEVESGLNDPMAFVLVFAFTGVVADKQELGAGLAWFLLQQMSVGLVVGLVSGWIWVRILRVAARSGPSLYPVFTIAAALTSVGVAGVLGGSGLLAAYLGGIVVGNHHIPYRATVNRIYSTLAWLSQIAMFFILGLLIAPGTLLENGGDLIFGGALIALWVAFVSRPLVVAPLLMLFRVPWRENLLVCWGGLRGAVPIILATVPVLAIAKGDQAAVANSGIDRMFAVVFMAVVVGSIVPGAMVRPVTHWLGMRGGRVKPAEVEIDFVTSNELGHIDRTFLVPAGAISEGKTLRELSLPGKTTVLMVLRGKEFIAPRGDTVIMAGDHVMAIFEPGTAKAIEAFFAAPENGTG
ncbi:MAG: potassium/proton antiporter [Phycisphaerales bacterium]|nr:potassium/proton antiporter [Phycisphaerales bacterium]